MNLKKIPKIIGKALRYVESDRAQLSAWEEQVVEPSHLIRWADTVLAESWGKKAACRMFHVCNSGFDVEYADPFVGDRPSKKKVRRVRRVRGAPFAAKNFYDVSQALVWVASTRTNADERVKWQSRIPELVNALGRVNVGA